MGKYLSVNLKVVIGQFSTVVILTMVFLVSAKSFSSGGFNISATLILTLIICGMLVSVGSSFLTAKFLCGSLGDSLGAAQRVAGGDFTTSFEANQRDEVGKLIGSINEISNSMRSAFMQIKGMSESLYFSTDSLDELSGSMTEKSDFTRDKASMVATAAEEMSTNMNSVAAAVEQASVNMNVISTAIEELSSTVQEIAQNTERAQSITSNAVTKAETTTTNVNKLGNAAYEITKVTEVITEISEQTNLLALNATIEAARAGEAGKGFAVVANEIKELAKQTADATQEIRNKIDGIQQTTDITVREIAQITEVISEIDETVTGIATAVEEQTATTQEISSNIVQASEGIQEINENVAQSTSVVGEIAADINAVSMNAVHSAEDGVEVQYAINEMHELTTRLKDQVDKFEIGSPKFDIVKIKQAHMAFKDNLRKVMKGELKMQPDEVATEKTCMFGKWFYSEEGQRYGHLPTYKDVEKYHAIVHDMGRNIVTAVNEDDHDKTRDMLAQLDEARISMFKHLEKLYSE
ncbi:MAG: HAMP domain-containing protein [Desulfobulbaceae bacterium]|nr:MAG: HAMP domain-containing protein [Desulfobulbaceae bacterium]